jgi:hypothetical protein
MAREKQRLHPGEAAMLLVVRVFLFLDVALTCFVAAQFLQLR